VNGAGLAFDAAVTLGRFRLEARFDVAPGRPLALVGPSGAGKSTTLALVAGLLRPDRARIALGPRVLCDTEARIDLAPPARRVGLLFQDYALFPHLTVRENVAYGARLRHRERRAAEAAVDEWLERLGVDELGRERVDRLSGGQRQRVAMARTLAARPEALLLDEPLASLDTATRAGVRARLRDFVATVGLPTLVITHDPVDALILGERIAVLEAGRVTQEGSKDDLLRHPRTGFVAELAGLNLHRVRLAPGEGLRAATAGPLTFHLLAGPEHQGEVHLAFAPSEVTLSPARPAGSSQNVFQGTVSEIVPLTDRLRVAVDAGVTLLADVTREGAQALSLAAGAPVWCSIKATALRVYD